MLPFSVSTAPKKLFFFCESRQFTKTLPPNNPMTKNLIAAAVGSLFAILLLEPHSFGQSLSGTSLVITGSSSLNTLEVTGTATMHGNLSVSGTVDFLGNNLWLGSWLSDPTRPGVVISYTDATTAPTPSLLKFTAYRPSHGWLWEHNNTSQTSTIPMMKLDANHVLTLYTTSGNAAIALDPNGAIALNGSNLLTQSAADSLYVSANAGLFAANGTLGINTTAPMTTLDVRGGAALGLGEPTGYAGAEHTIEITGYGGWTPLTLIGGSGVVECWTDYSEEQVLMFGAGRPGEPSDGDFHVTTGGGQNPWIERMLIQASSGNVGIATSSPQATLDVQGNARFSGPVRIEQQGDLDMGQFAVEPPPAEQQNTPIRSTTQSSVGSPAVSGTGTFRSGTSGVMMSGTTVVH